MKIACTLLRVIFLLFRYGLISKKKWINKTNLAPSLSYFLQQLGPVYIKFGQVLSTRPDIVGQEVALALQKLQDSLPPFSYEEATKTLIKDLGQNYSSTLFHSFNEEVIAAASISQVYKAQLQNGDTVAVKILRPQIHQKYSSSIQLLQFFAKIIPKFCKNLVRIRIAEVVELFQKVMHIELDLRLEAAAMSEMRQNFRNDSIVYIPKIYWDLTTKNILVTEWIDGIAINDKKALTKNGISLEEISRRIAICFFNQAYRDGFFHADLHHGNILVRDDHKIVLLDFGITGRLDEKDRLAVAEILYAFIHRDYKKVAQIHKNASYLPQNADLDLFAQYCRSVGEPILLRDNNKILAGSLLSQLFQISEKFGMETQIQLVLLQKTMVMVEGIGSNLTPNLNMWAMAEDWIMQWAKQHITPEAKALRKIKNCIEKLLEYS